MSENWNLGTVADDKEAPPEKPPDAAAPVIPSVLSSDHTLGEIMRMAREARGFAREQAAIASNIPGYYLTMIETDDYSAIADQLYLLPFLRRYATFVGLEPEEVASRFIRDVQRADMNPGRMAEPIEMFAPRKPLPWGAIMTVVAAIIVAAGGWFGYRYYAARKSARANSQAPVAAEQIVPAAEQAAPKTADTAPATVEPSPMAVPPAAVAPAPIPSAADPAAAVSPAMVSPAGVSPGAVSPKVPHSVASPLGKPKSAGHAAARQRSPLKSALASHRLSMQD